MTREQVAWWAWWVTNLCLAVGSEVGTAWAVGAEFAKGLERSKK